MQERISGRQLKAEIARGLAAQNWESRLQGLLAYPTQRLVSPLFALLLSKDPSVRWHAVSAFGAVLASLAEADLEAARVVMRRFMWSLTDESGGIGWGSPEAMAEGMACHERLAREYHSIFLSYMLEKGGPDNFLEYAPLREGAYWGAARLSQARPELVEPCRSILAEALNNEERPQSLGYLCLAFCFLGPGNGAVHSRLRELESSRLELWIYFNRRFRRCLLGELASESLAAPGAPGG